MPQIIVVYNEASGSGGSTKQTIQAAFASQQSELKFVKIGKNIAADLARAVQAGGEILVAAGGDGTVNAVAQAAVKHKKSLGVLPLGTLNHFAKDLGLPMDLKQAAKIILKNHRTQVDYCTVNDKVFVNNSSIGMYPGIVQTREALSPKLGKWPAAFVAAVKTALQVKTFRLRLTMADTERTFRAPLVFIGNNSYQFEKIGFANRAQLTSGKLFIYVVRANRLGSLVRLALVRFMGKRLRHHDYLNESQTELQIHSAKSSLPVALDGEVVSLRMPLKYQMHPRGLTVLK